MATLNSREGVMRVLSVDTFSENDFSHFTLGWTIWLLLGRVVDGYLSKEYSTGMLVWKKKKIMQTTTAKSKIHACSVSQKTHGTWRQNIMHLYREKNFLGREMAKKNCACTKSSPEMSKGPSLKQNGYCVKIHACFLIHWKKYNYCL